MLSTRQTACFFAEDIWTEMLGTTCKNVYHLFFIYALDILVYKYVRHIFVQ